MAVKPNPTNTEESGDKGGKAKKRKTKTKPVTQSPKRTVPEKKLVLPSSDSDDTVNQMFTEDDGERNKRGRKRRQ